MENMMIELSIDLSTVLYPITIIHDCEETLIILVLLQVNAATDQRKPSSCAAPGSE